MTCLKTLREDVARAICDDLTPPYDTLYEDKSEWVADRGARMPDVNGPYRHEVRAAADAAIKTVFDALDAYWTARNNALDPVHGYGSLMVVLGHLAEARRIVERE